MSGPQDFRPQPYEQLVRVLRRMGENRAAREVAIAKQVRLRKYGRLSMTSRIWSCFMGLTVGHGYKPWRVLLPALGMVLIGWLVFQVADSQGAMVPAKEWAYIKTQRAHSS